MDEIVEELSKAITPERVLPPTKVFMCGGEIDNARSDGTFSSMRHFIFNYIKQNDPQLFEKIILADTVNLWLQDSSYSDLLELEQDFAGLVSAIPLFLESPGSCAELGSFILFQHVPERLLFFVENQFRGDRSFIGLGPVKRLAEQCGEDRVQSYIWPIGQNSFQASDVLPHVAPEIVTKIKALCDTTEKSNVFNAAIAAHKILLICDIINIFHIIRVSEIEKIINGMKVLVNNKLFVLVRSETKKYLLIASKLRMIEKIHDGDDAYYISLDSTQDGFIKYDYAKSAKRNSRAAWKIVTKDYIDKSDARRKNTRDKWLDQKTASKK